MRQLTIEPEFRDKIPPLSSEEFSRLEENILADGEVREPIVVWGNTIIDGHNRWRVIQAHPEIPFKVKQMNFADKWDAIAWMCRNQLGRRNLTDEQKTYLIGKQYEAQKMTEKFHGNQHSGGHQNDDHQPGRTKNKIAEALGIGSSTVERAEYFSKGLDAAETASPGIKDAILSGEVKAPKSVIARIRSIPEDQRPAAVEAIKRGERLTPKPAVVDGEHRESVLNAPAPAADEVLPDDDCREFTIEDLCSLVDSAIDNFDASLDMHLISTDHLKPLDREEGRGAVLKCLHRAHSVVEKYINYIKGRKDVV